jgi:hypothetical protein
MVSLVGGSTTAHTQLLPHPGLDRDTQVAKERAEELKIAEELEGESYSLSAVGTALHAMRCSIQRNTHVNSLSSSCLVWHQSLASVCLAGWTRAVYVCRLALLL